MMPCDSAKILAYLVYSGQNNIIPDREQFQVSDTLQSHTRFSFLQ